MGLRKRSEGSMKTGPPDRTAGADKKVCCLAHQVMFCTAWGGTQPLPSMREAHWATERHGPSALPLVGCCSLLSLNLLNRFAATVFKSRAAWVQDDSSKYPEQHGWDHCVVT